MVGVPRPTLCVCVCVRVADYNIPEVPSTEFIADLYSRPNDSADSLSNFKFAEPAVRCAVARIWYRTRSSVTNKNNYNNNNKHLRWKCVITPETRINIKYLMKNAEFQFQFKIRRTREQRTNRCRFLWKPMTSEVHVKVRRRMRCRFIVAKNELWA